MSRRALLAPMRLTMLRRSVRQMASFTAKLNLTERQLAIVEASRKSNVCVSAIPGSGKTATAAAIVGDNPERSVVIVTYSKRLQLETKKRLNQLYPDKGARVCTFHSLAGQLFSTPANEMIIKDDFALRDLRRGVRAPIWSGNPYKTVIFDEQQDCTEDLYWLACLFIRSLHLASGAPPRLVVLGDPRQAIFEFRRSDARYLECAEPIFADLSSFNWTKLKLDCSFRLSRQDATFLNEVFLKGDPDNYLQGDRDGDIPIYLRGNVWDTSALYNHNAFLPLINVHGAKNTVILAPRVRKNTPLACLANKLSMEGFPVAVSEDGPLDNAVARDKLVITTYHQFKGSERDLVIVLGADSSYFTFLGRDLPNDRCPNAIFVALTRARKQLVVIQNTNRSHPMPFILESALESTSKVLNFTAAKGGTLLEQTPPRDSTVSDLVRSLSAEAHNYTRLQIEKGRPLQQKDWIKPEATVVAKNTGLPEKVSDLSGVAIMAAFQWHTNKKIYWPKFMADEPPAGYKWKTEEPPAGRKRQSQWFCKKACEYHDSLYKCRWIQMKGGPFSWLDEHFDAAQERLREQFLGASRLEFEYKLGGEFPIGDEDADHPPPSLSGRADIIRFDFDKNGEEVASVWEIKFVRELSRDHAVQAAIKGYLWAKKEKKERLPPITLFNVKNNEKWDITGSMEDVETLIVALLKAKSSARRDIPDGEFRENCSRIRKEVEQLLPLTTHKY